MAATRMTQTTRLTVVTLTLAMACASTSTGRPMAGTEHYAGARSDVITASELSRMAPTRSVMDAVEQARPWFLHPRGGVSTASLDGSPPTELSVLRNIPITDVKEVRLLRDDGPPAMRPDGTVVVGNVILVVTRKGPE